HRAPRVARRLGLLPFAVRFGRGLNNGRRGRVGDLVVWLREGERAAPFEGAALPALARAALLGLYLLHGLQGQLGRVQGDGARALWRAALREAHPRRAGRSS